MEYCKEFHSFDKSIFKHFQMYSLLSQKKKVSFFVCSLIFRKQSKEIKILRVFILFINLI